MRRYSVVMVATSTILGVILLQPVAQAADDGSFVDITSTDEGQSLATDHAVYESAQLDRPVDPSEVSIFRAELDGDAVYASTLDASQMEGVTLNPSGDFDVEGGGETDQLGEEAEPRAVDGWVRTGGSCFPLITTSHGYMEHCYASQRWTTTVSGAWVHSLNHWARFWAKSGHYLVAAKISTTPKSPILQKWADWDPITDTTQGCGTNGLSVSFGPASFSTSGYQCHTWDIQKYGSTYIDSFANVDRGYTGTSPDRSVEYLIEVTTPSNYKYPVWTLGWGLGGCEGITCP